MPVTDHMASFCVIYRKTRGMFVCRYLWELQLSSQEGTMHMVLQPLHKGHMGRMCPPVTLLLLLVTALGLGEMIAQCNFSGVDCS